MRRILSVNLSSRATSEFFVPRDWENNYIGGAILGARILADILALNPAPYSEESPLLFLTGPLTGTLGPAVGRFVVCGKSPATGMWAESNCGGFWGPMLRFAGYDGILVTGISEDKVFLSIVDGKIEFNSAKTLWGLDTYTVQEKVKEVLGNSKVRVLGIGRGGENRVVFAGLFCDHGRTAGRTGLGAVMGSKNLKAIAVYGNNPVYLAEPNEFSKIRSQANIFIKNDLFGKVAHDLGTASVADYSNYLGTMPKKYFSLGEFSGADIISGSSIAETILKGTKACHGCVIACGRVVGFGDGRLRKGPEYETLVGFGPNLLIDDLKAIAELNELCDSFGIDTISTSNVIGLAFRLHEKGIIKNKDCAGVKLQWGDANSAKELIHQIANRKGLGAIMAEGAKKFAQNFAVEEEAVQINGLEVAAHDPRGSSGMAVVYATSPRGACHNKSDYFFVDWGQADESLGIKYFDRHAGAEKSENIVKHQNLRAVNDALVMCLFANIPMEQILGLVNSAQGVYFSQKTLVEVGERGWNLKRCLNLKMGYTTAGEVLPKALQVPYDEGGSKDYVIPFEQMMDSYYQARGWDRKTGQPSDEKLESLGLSEFLCAGMQSVLKMKGG